MSCSTRRPIRRRGEGVVRVATGFPAGRAGIGQPTHSHTSARGSFPHRRPGTVTAMPDERGRSTGRSGSDDDSPRRGRARPVRLAGRVRRRVARLVRPTTIRSPRRTGSTCSRTRHGGSAGSTTASTAREGAYAKLRRVARRSTPRAASARCGSTSTTASRRRPAIAGGWLRRARHALDDDRSRVEYGALRLREAETAHGRGDLETGTAAAREVVALGRRLRSADLEAEALQTLGRVLIDRAIPPKGLATLDEAMLFAVEGRLRPYSTGKVYCSLISVCEALGDLRRAAEWSEATDALVATSSVRGVSRIVPGASGVVAALAWRVERGRGTSACARAPSSPTLNVTNAAAGHAEIGEIRRRIGDLEGAEDGLSRAEQLSGQPQSGLALLRLAQGQRRRGDGDHRPRARRDHVGSPGAGPAASRACPDRDRGRRPRPRATAALEELESIATDYASPALSRRRCRRAAGCSSRRTTRRPARRCAHAADRWQELGVPHEVATARMLQGAACREAGDRDGAAASFEAAASAVRATRRGARPPRPARHHERVARPARRAQPNEKSRSCGSWRRA